RSRPGDYPWHSGLQTQRIACHGDAGATFARTGARGENARLRDGAALHLFNYPLSHRTAAPESDWRKPMLRDLQPIVESLADELGRAVAIDDHQMHLVAHTAHVDTVDKPRIESVMQR